MVTEDAIRTKLSLLGAKTDEINTIIAQIETIILGKSFVAYLETLPEPLQNQMRNLEQKDVREFLREHQKELPAFPPDKFAHIHSATWHEYFASVGAPL
jgi:hypothetical protein